MASTINSISQRNQRTEGGEGEMSHKRSHSWLQSGKQSPGGLQILFNHCTIPPRIMKRPPPQSLFALLLGLRSYTLCNAGIMTNIFYGLVCSWLLSTLKEITMSLRASKNIYAPTLSCACGTRGRYQSCTPCACGIQGLH